MGDVLFKHSSVELSVLGSCDDFYVPYKFFLKERKKILKTKTSENKIPLIYNGENILRIHYEKKNNNKIENTQSKSEKAEAPGTAWSQNLSKSKSRIVAKFGAVQI